MGWGVASRVYSPAHATSGWRRGWEGGGPEAGGSLGGWGRELASFPGLSDAGRSFAPPGLRALLAPSCGGTPRDGGVRSETP